MVSLRGVIRISPPAHLDCVQHIVGSGTDVLEFAVEGERENYVWEGSEAADWEIKGVNRVENIEEDGFIMYPAGECFVCEIGKGEDGGVVRCWNESE